MATITVGEVKLFLGVDPLDVFDERQVEGACRAAIDYATKVRPDVDWSAPSASQRQGLLMLAGRLYERRGSDSTDVNAGYEFGGPIPMIGREIQELLGIGRYFQPVVA